MEDDAEIADEIKCLMAEITAAFHGVPRPSTTRSVSDGIDDEWIISVERAAELAALDPEQCWEDVTDEAIENSQNYFTFSDDEGWQFYLPAYMMHWLRSFPLGYNAICEVCVLADPRFDALDPRQLAVTRWFIEFYWRMVRSGRVSH